MNSTQIIEMNMVNTIVEFLRLLSNINKPAITKMGNMQAGIMIFLSLFLC